MNKNVIKIIGLIVGLVVLLAAILWVLLCGIHIGPINVVSVTGIAGKSGDVAAANSDLEKAEAQYEVNMQSLETAKKDFETQKQSYENLGDETIAAIKEATKEEEYFIEYLWITLGNYATKHNLVLAIIEPGGTASVKTETTTATNSAASDTVSTGTGTVAGPEGVTTTTNAATTGSPTSGTQQTSNIEKETVSNPIDATTISNVKDLTVQVKGSYIDVADFVFEVENDKSLRFRLDNIKMKSAGGTDVTTMFNVKDFSVLKSLN